MVNSIIILCEDSPFGKNSAVESIRMATGLIAVGDIDECKVIFMGDAVYFLNKNINPEALNLDSFSNIMRLAWYHMLLRLNWAKKNCGGEYLWGIIDLRKKRLRQ